jgi:hypothetical protein
MSLANLIGGISAENRLLRPCQQDRPVLVLLCGTPCKYGLWRSWREPVNSERLYKRSRPLLRVGSREATLCLFVAPRQRTPCQLMLAYLVRLDLVQHVASYDVRRVEAGKSLQCACLDSLGPVVQLVVQRIVCKSAYLHVRRHMYCAVTTRAATPVTTPVLPCQDACSDTCILMFCAGRPGAS